MFKLKYNLKDDEITEKHEDFVNQLKDYIISQQKNVFYHKMKI